MLSQITPVILTYNEDPNIERTMSRLHWAEKIIVVDSGSTDKTLKILHEINNVVVFQHRFDSHSEQWNFAITQTGITTDWILALDADYLLSLALIKEIESLRPDEKCFGYEAEFQYCIDGRPVRGSLYPPVTVLYRNQGAKYIQDGHTQRITLSGPVKMLKAIIMHDDRKSFSRWVKSQDKYANIEAKMIGETPLSGLSWPDRVRCLLVVAPLIVPVYILVFRAGILSGVSGLKYAGQRFIAELMLSKRILFGFLKKLISI